MEQVKTSIETNNGAVATNSYNNANANFKTEEVNLSASDSIQKIDVSDIKDLKIAVSASDALNGNFITGNKDVLSDGELTYTKRDDGTVLIKRNGQAVGFTLLENIKTNVHETSGNNGTNSSQQNNQRKNLLIRNYNYFENNSIKSILSDVDILYEKKDFVGPLQEKVDKDLKYIYTAGENGSITKYRYGDYINIYKTDKNVSLTFNVDNDNEQNLSMLLDDKIAKYVDFKNIKNIRKINNGIDVSFENGNIIHIVNDIIYEESKDGKMKFLYYIDENNKLYDARNNSKKPNNTGSGDKQQNNKPSADNTKQTEPTTKPTESTQPTTEPTTNMQDPTEPTSSTQSTTNPTTESTTEPTSTETTQSTGTQDPTEPSEFSFKNVEKTNNESLNSILDDIKINENNYNVDYTSNNSAKVEYNEFVNIYTDGNQTIPTYNIDGIEERMDYLMDPKLSNYVDLKKINSIEKVNGDIDITFEDNSKIHVIGDNYISGENEYGEENFSYSIGENNELEGADFSE